MLDWNDLRKSTTGWKLSAAQKQRIESYCLHAKKPAPAILIWLKHCAKPALAAAVAAAALFAMFLIWPLFRQPNTNETITAGAPDARPDTPYENPEKGDGKEVPSDNGTKTDGDQTQSDTTDTPDTTQTDPANQPASPVVPSEWKDPAISDLQRSIFFDLTQEYRFDALYDFDEANPIDLEAFKYYCWYHIPEEEITFVDGGCTYSGAKLEGLANGWFGTNYGLKSDESVFLKAQSARSLPLTEVIRYTEEKGEYGALKITARCIVYYYNDYEYLDAEHLLNHETYAQRRKAILKGRASGFDSYSVFDVSFYSDRSLTVSKGFTRFISYTNYGTTDGTVELSLPAWPTPAGEAKDPVDYNAAIKVSYKDETGAQSYYSFQNEDSAALLRLLDSFVYNESTCECISPISVYLPGESVSRFTINPDEKHVQSNAAQHTLSKKEAAALQAIFDRNLTEETQIIPSGRLNINSSITAYVTSIEEEGQFCRAYTFQNEDSRALLTLLDETPFTITSTCYCIHMLSIHLEDGTSFGFGSESGSYLVTHAVNDAYNGVYFTDEDAATIEKILTRNLIEKNRKPELDLYRPH